MADLVAPLPLIRLYGGMTLKLEAINAATGAPVAGVRVSEVAIYGARLNGDGDEIPLYTAYLLPRDE